MRRLLLATAALLCGCSPESSTETTEATPDLQTRFDLDCRGTRYIRSEATPFEQLVHIDLEVGRYCTGECAEVYRIESRHPGLIVFRDRPSDGYNSVDKAMWFPDTGQYLAEFAASYRLPYESRTIAVCTRSELTASFPTAPGPGEPTGPYPSPGDALHAGQPGRGAGEAPAGP
jgi:hypothetical protein